MTQNSNKLDEGAARKQPLTKEYQDSWERIFGKKEDIKETEEIKK